MLHRVTLKCRLPRFVLSAFLRLSSRAAPLASPVAAHGASSPGAFSLFLHVLGDVTLVLTTRGTLFSVRTGLILERGGLSPR